jgi:DUF971 family protein
VGSFRFLKTTFGVGLMLTIFSSRTLASTSMTCGDILSGTISTAGQVDQYTFSLQAGRIITLTLADTGGFDPFNGVVAEATLYDTSSKVVVSFGANGQRQVTLASTGAYVVQINSNDFATTGTYSFGLQCRNPAQTAAALSCGGLVNGELASAQVDQYTFSGEPYRVVTLTLADTGGFDPFNGVVAEATLYDPSGKAVVSFAANGQQQVALALAGTYVVQINSNDFATTGTYSFGLQCRNPAQTATGLSCGGLGNGTLASAQVDQYAFSGQASGLVTLTLADKSGFDPFDGVVASATLFAPSGEAVVTFTADGQKEVTLTETGTYVVQVSSNDFATTGTYGFGVECLSGMSGEGFVPIPPCRIADTRTGSGFSGAFGTPSLVGGSTRSFPIPSSSCGVPDTAQVYSLNVTAVPPAPLGYLSIWPTGELQPLVSTLNSPDGEIVANAAIVPAGTSGAVNVFASDNTDLVIDIDGYFIPETASTDAFYTDAPCRIADTRSGFGFTGAFGPPSMAGGSTRAFPILLSSCGIAATATAYSLNMTVVPSGWPGYLSLWPEGQEQPWVSTLNWSNDDVVANAALVPAGTPNGGVDVFVSNNTDVLIDIDGHFGLPTAPNPLHLYPLSPCRIADTRGGPGFSGPFGPPSLIAGATRTFPIPSSFCGIPSTAKAYSFNLTVVPPGPLGYLTVWPTGGLQPVVSTLNSYSGIVVANAALVPAGTGAAINVFVDDNTDLVIDIDGYFAP